MKLAKKVQQDRATHVTRSVDLNYPEEVVVPSVAALVVMLLTGLLYLALPPNVVIGPNWLLLVVEGMFVVPLFIDSLSAWNFSHTARRLFVLVPLGISILALVVGVALFILTLATDKHATNLLRSAVLLWSFNILVFALWYWEIDGGGPWKRHLSGHHAADFLFPQLVNGGGTTPLNGERAQRDFPRSISWTLRHIGLKQRLDAGPSSSLRLDPRRRSDLIA